MGAEVHLKLILIIIIPGQTVDHHIKDMDTDQFHSNTNQVMLLMITIPVQAMHQAMHQQVIQTIQHQVIQIILLQATHHHATHHQATQH